MFSCPCCSKKYTEKNSLYLHLKEKHESDLGTLTPAHFYFNYKNHKDKGSCVICKKETKFNEVTEKYSRFCSKKCQDKYREEILKRMNTKYGKNHLLNDPEKQKEMLKNRKISGIYTWENGFKHTYTGTYEKNFLEFLEYFLQWKVPEDIFSPSPEIFKYIYKSKQHFYIPDFYISSLDIYIEIKSFTNKHYRERDIEAEKAKDKVMKDKNFIKIGENDFQVFIDYLEDLKLKQN